MCIRIPGRAIWRKNLAEPNITFTLTSVNADGSSNNVSPRKGGGISNVSLTRKNLRQHIIKI
jgi:hypothetical protein